VDGIQGQGGFPLGACAIAIAADPGDATSLALRPTPEAHALAGSIAWVGGDRDRARAQWKAALALDPVHPGVAEALSRSETAPMSEAGKAPTR
jgi:hypothetical protein